MPQKWEKRLPVFCYLSDVNALLDSHLGLRLEDYIHDWKGERFKHARPHMVRRSPLHDFLDL